MSGPFKKVSCVFPVPLDVQSKMTQPQENITFTFFDPTETLVRLLVFSPVAARKDNLALFPESGEVLHDFCNGDRLRRIQATLPEGTAALTAVIFFDEINRDQKGFATGDGALIVGGSLKQRVRESTHAKASIGTFPNVQFPKVHVHYVYSLSYALFVFIISVHFTVHLRYMTTILYLHSPTVN